MCIRDSPYRERPVFNTKVALSMLMARFRWADISDQISVDQDAGRTKARHLLRRATSSDNSSRLLRLARGDGGGCFRLHVGSDRSAYSGAWGHATALVQEALFHGAEQLQ